MKECEQCECYFRNEEMTYCKESEKLICIYECEEGNNEW